MRGEPFTEHTIYRVLFTFTEHAFGGGRGVLGAGSSLDDTTSRCIEASRWHVDANVPLFSSGARVILSFFSE